MKSMIKIMTLTILLVLLLPGIHGDAYSIHVADSEDLSAYIFELQANPDVFSINDPYHYSNYYASGLVGTQNAVRSQYIQSFTLNDIDYVFETLVKTQGNKDVPVYIATEELTPERIAGYIYAAQSRPGVEILGNPTEDYNCHSYAWYMESTSNPYWITDVEIYAYDAHTVWRENTETPQPGDICVYLRNGMMVHSAVVVSSDGDTTICRSKWGPSVLCEHPIASVPTEYLDVDKVLRYYVMTITPHEWSFESVDVNQHNRTCTICNNEETLSCEYEFTSNGDGTHTGICVCGNVKTATCRPEYTNITNTRHSVSCTECGYYIASQACQLNYRAKDGKTHTVSCTKCENRRTQNCGAVIAYTGSGQHRTTCHLCEYDKTENCSLVHTYCGDGSQIHTHNTACSVCGNQSQTGIACTFVYRSHGDNTHSYLCSLCGYVKIDHAACLFNANNICRTCGAPKNGAVINKQEEITPE